MNLKSFHLCCFLCDNNDMNCNSCLICNSFWQHEDKCKDPGELLVFCLSLDHDICVARSGKTTKESDCNNNCVPRTIKRFKV